MKRFFRNALIFLILVALLAGSVLADGIMPLSDDALDSSLIQIADDQFNELTALLDSVPSELKTGWTSSYPYAMSGSWYNRVINLLTDIKSNTSGSSGSSGSSGDSKLVSGWSTSYPTGYSSSWYYKVITLLNNIASSGGSSVLSDLKTGWSSSYASGYSSSWFYKVSSSLSTVADLLSNTTYGWAHMQSELNYLYYINDHLAGVDTYAKAIYDTVLDINNEKYTATIDNILLSAQSIRDSANDLEVKVDSMHQWLYFIMADVISIREFLTPKPYEDELKDSQEGERGALLAALQSDDRTADISSVLHFQQSFPDFFASPDADFSLIFDNITEGSNEWFSQSTADALTSGAAVASYSLDEPVSETPLLDQRVQAISDYFGWGDVS